MIVVTGGAGFIGSNLVRALNQAGHRNILVVDDLKDGMKFSNLVDLDICDYLDKQDFLTKIQNNDIPYKIDALFHQGACSSTTEWDGQMMMQNNYEYSKKLFHYAQEHGVPFIYASSAAVYGASLSFKESIDFEKPLNVYGYSKFLFDQYIRRQTNLKAQVVGLRYFNVYGPGEQHKGSMASVAYHLNQQLIAGDSVKLFDGCDGYGPGEQTRDFVYVDDVADVNLWFLDHPEISGIFNLGTGKSQPFNDVAHAVIDWHQRGRIQYVPFPEHLKGCYQSFTEADLSQLRAVGCDHVFQTVEQGVKRYLDVLNKKSSTLSKVKELIA